MFQILRVLLFLPCAHQAKVDLKIYFLIVQKSNKMIKEETEILFSKMVNAVSIIVLSKVNNWDIVYWMLCPHDIQTDFKSDWQKSVF